MTQVFFIVSVINKHQNAQWLQCYSMSCLRLLNFGLNMDIYLYDLKMCDTDYRYVVDSIIIFSFIPHIIIQQTLLDQQILPVHVISVLVKYLLSVDPEGDGWNNTADYLLNIVLRRTSSNCTLGYPDI